MLKIDYMQKIPSRLIPHLTPLDMDESASSLNSCGNLSPLEFFGACAPTAMQNVAPGAPIISPASSDDGTVGAEALIPKLSPLPLPPNDADSSSHGDPLVVKVGLYKLFDGQ